VSVVKGVSAFLVLILAAMAFVTNSTNILDANNFWIIDGMDALF
jgi:hypothetical protein